MTCQNQPPLTPISIKSQIEALDYFCKLGILFMYVLDLSVFLCRLVLIVHTFPLSGPIMQLIAQPFAPQTPLSVAHSAANSVIDRTCSHIHYHKVIASSLFSKFHPETPCGSALNHKAAVILRVRRRVAPRSSLLLAMMNKAVKLYSSLWNT